MWTLSIEDLKVSRVTRDGRGPWWSERRAMGITGAKRGVNVRDTRRKGGPSVDGIPELREKTSMD